VALNTQTIAAAIPPAMDFIRDRTRDKSNLLVTVFVIAMGHNSGLFYKIWSRHIMDLFSEVENDIHTQASK
jgi:hypothetical protein